MSLFKKLLQQESLDAAQRSVRQLGATAKPHSIRVLDTDQAPDHPFDGELVGEDSKPSLRDPKDNPCWSGYKPVGTKKKGGRTVPNCVPKEGIEEALGLYGPFTVTIQTGERPTSRTKTKKFKREDDAILWAEDWLEDFPQYPFATAEVTDPNGNVVWTTDEGVVEGLPGSLSKSDYMPGAVRHDLSNIKSKKQEPQRDRPVADIDPDWEDWEKEQAAKRKKKGVAEGQMPKTWHDVDPKLGRAVDKMSPAEKVKKGFAHPDTLKKKKEKQGVAEGILGDREYNRVMPVVKRIASEVSDYDRDEFGEELWSLLDQKYGSKFAQSVLQDSLDFYWDTYTELTGHGLDEASVYKKDQDLSSVSTQELEAFVKKHWGGGIPTWGQGESVKRAIRELRRRQKQGVAEGLGKDIKRGLQGWGSPQDKPADIVKRNKAYDVDTAKKLRATIGNPDKHSPQGLQKRVLDRKLKGVAEGVDILDQDSDLDQQVYTLNVNGKKVSFTYWDYENNFQNPDINDIYQQAKEQLGRKLPLEQIKDVAHAVFKSFEQGVAEGYTKNMRAAYDKGCEAGKKSLPALNNPYDSKTQPEEHKEWSAGHRSTVPDRSRFIKKQGVAEGAGKSAHQYHVVSKLDGNVLASYKTREEAHKNAHGNPVVSGSLETIGDRQYVREQGVAEGAIAERISVASNTDYKQMPNYKNYEVYVSKRPVSSKFGYIAYTMVGREEIKAPGKTPEEAVAGIQEKVDRILNAARVSDNASIDFNAKFATEILSFPGQPFFAKIENIGGEPKLVIAGELLMSEPAEMGKFGFQRAGIRNLKTSSDEATKLPGITLSKSRAERTGLIPNARYLIGNENQDDIGNRVFDLVYHSTVHSKSDVMRLNKPAITVGTARGAESERMTNEAARSEMDTPEFQRALASVKKSAAQGPKKTVYDPRTGKYKVVPVNDPKKDPLKESYKLTYEEILSNLKAKLGDYLGDVARAIKDTDLSDKSTRDSDRVGAVKTVTTDDGHEIRIHGNEDDGFRVTIKNKDSKAKFSSLKEAEIAAEMYCARRRTKPSIPSDYESEK